MKNKLLTLILFLMASLALAYPTYYVQIIPPTEYEEYDADIPEGDIYKYSIYCSLNSLGPYEYMMEVDNTSDILEIDLENIVEGIPGDYYCVGTAWSKIFQSESNYSEEFIVPVTEEDLSQLPEAPYLTSVDVT